MITKEMTTGADILHDPLLNKGTAFTYEERSRLGILGLLPPWVSTPEEQVTRFLGNLRGRATELEKYVDMIALLDRNETLFYRVVRQNIEEMLPIIYTPVVGAACQGYGHIFRRSRGLFITKREKGRIREVLRNWPRQDVRVIVVTDGERILGLGDLGANGMGIPVGKLSLYTACGGIPPSQTLPITLDVGTNNETLLKDPLYIGTHDKRITGAQYDELVDEFVWAVAEVFPRALLQFEDFANHNAFRLLEKYRLQVATFNDDIQGTAAVALAGLYSAAKMKGRALGEETLLFHGAGEAAIGIADLVVSAMVAEGVPRAKAAARCWFVDSKGLVESGRKDLQAHKKPYAHAHKPLASLSTAVKQLKPTCLIGVSGQASQFTKEIITEMARLNPRPVIFALSNPTANSECTAQEAYGWTKGKAIFASGSPFAPVAFEGRTFVSGQANNAYIFPGVGLGAVAARAVRITDEMFSAAAKALADLTSKEDLAKGCLFPSLTKILDVSAKIGAATAEVAFARGLAGRARPEDLMAHVKEAQYRAEYPNY